MTSMEPEANKNERNEAGVEKSLPNIMPLSLYITERSPVPVVAVEGLTHIVRYVNSAFCRLAGQKSETLLGRPFAESVPEGEKNGYLSLLDEVLRTGTTATIADQEHRPSLSGVYWTYTAWPILDLAERPIGVMVQVTDTSVGVQARAEMREISEAVLLFGLEQNELVDALRQREETVAQNEKLLQSLAKQNERMGELNVRLQRAMQETHHRVKNNLQGIYALIELQIDDDSPTVPTSALHRVGSQVRTLASLHDFLTRQAKGDQENETISTTVSLGILLPLLRLSIGTRRIHSEVADVMLSIDYSASLSLLISELVNNAVKHGDGDISVTLRREGEEIGLAVGDSGKGFPPDFDPREAANIGLDLALSLARHDLRGKITFTNRPQGGALVRVTFPMPVS
jgi:PAS domain S-box-containing protein